MSLGITLGLSESTSEEMDCKDSLNRSFEDSLTSDSKEVDVASIGLLNNELEKFGISQFKHSHMHDVSPKEL